MVRHIQNFSHHILNTNLQEESCRRFVSGPLPQQCLPKHVTNSEHTFRQQMPASINKGGKHKGKTPKGRKQL